MEDRYVQVPIKKDIQLKWKALKGQDSYSNNLEKLMRTGGMN